MNIKYIEFLTKLKEVFKKKKKHYPVKNIIFNICAADEDNLTYFSGKDILSVTTIDEVFHHIAREFKYFNYTILQTFVDASGCREAKKLMDNYVKDVENILITGFDLKSECDNVQISTEQIYKTLLVICEKDELSAKKLTSIIETLQQSFNLPRSSVVVRKVIQNCKILECRILPAVEDHLLQCEITAYELRSLSELKIASLVLNDKMELQIPSDCSAKVISVSIAIEISILIVYFTNYT